MASANPMRRLAALAATFAAALLLASPAHALRIMDWNILNYPGNTGPARDPLYRTVLGPLSPDALTTEETTSQAGVTEFLNSLNVMEPGQWAAATFVDGNDTDCGFFYKPAKFQFLGQWAFYPNSANQLRYVHVYRIKPVGYSADAAEIRIYGLHLKASMGFESQRLAECTGLRDTLNALPPGVHALVMGDYNFYTGLEPGMQKLVESQVNNRGRLYDALGLQGISWQDNVAVQPYWTQSPCKTGDTGCASGAATGGLDDRFDLILPTYDWKDGEGLEFVPGTYIAVGNDGQHHNNSIQDPPTIPEGASYASALHAVSDHLPVRVDIQVPAKINTATSPIAFGSVIVGASASTNLAVSNPATPPADTLEYSYSPPAGFTAPLGTISLLPGGNSLDAVALNTASAGAKSGNLTIASNDVDLPSQNVALSGTVLDHAVASLDSLTLTTAATLDLGDHHAGDFVAGLVRVHDLGYDALQARLAVGSAAMTGPAAGRFAILGGFTPLMVAGTAAGWNVAFDDTGAPSDSTYQADLTFTTADEALPGATAEASLTVHLRARVTSATADAPPVANLPVRTQLYNPLPNPMHGAGGVIRFDLATAAHAHVEVFDLGGRRVATLADDDYAPGTYSVRWNARHDDGALAGAGLYFVRLSGRGLATETVRMAFIR